MTKLVLKIQKKYKPCSFRHYSYNISIGFAETISALIIFFRKLQKKMILREREKNAKIYSVYDIMLPTKLDSIFITSLMKRASALSIKKGTDYSKISITKQEAFQFVLYYKIVIIRYTIGLVALKRSIIPIFKSSSL